MALTLVVTPNGIRCPLACDYCYNADPQLKQRVGSRNMSMGLLSILLARFMSYPQGTYEIIWHGGEPTLAGISFYERVVEMQKQLMKALSIRVPFINHFQTNGVLINNDWVKFLKSNKFKVGISIDGPQDVHDAQRKYRDGSGSHADAMRGANLLLGGGVSIGVGTVVTKKTLEDPIRVFEYMREHFKVFDFSPCFTSIDKEGRWTQEVVPQDYAQFVISVFDHWFELDDPTIRIKSFRYYVEAALGHTPKICSMANGCYKFLSVDGEGNVYPCGRLHGIPALCFGSVRNQTFVDIQQRGDYLEYQAQARRLSEDCGGCRWKYACNNGCTASRYTEMGTILPKTPFCESTKEILEHVSAKVTQVQP